ncbi:uncharacterized protein FOMMEDRAFT_144038, partial [Fomitiporia mediterranea MF3/22]|uniref:uncharacterized protein n=1 Tax=Fomitiporia mediterranea (strain MF3/22) TaxID=694068 RepID=UPI0004409495
MNAMPLQGRKGSESLSSNRSRRAKTGDTDSHRRSDAGKSNTSSQQSGQAHRHANGGKKQITVKSTKASRRVTLKTGTSGEDPGPRASSKSSRDSVTSKGTAETTKHSVDNRKLRTTDSHITKSGRKASHSKKPRKRTKPFRLTVGGKIDARHTGHWDLLTAQLAIAIANVYESLSQETARTASPSRTREVAQQALRSDAFGIYTWIVAIVKFGDNPGLEVDLVVDTGSGLTHVDEKLIRDCCDDSLKQSKIQPERYVKEIFGTDPVSTEGPLYKTTITVGNTKRVEIKEQMFFVAKNAKYNGVLGLGPRSLTKGTIVDHPEETVPTVLENLMGHDDLDKGVLGLHILPFPTGGDGASFTGYLDFGGVDESSFTQNMVYMDMTDTGLTADYYGLEAKLTYGDSGLYIIGSR